MNDKKVSAKLNVRGVTCEIIWHLILNDHYLAQNYMQDSCCYL